MWLADMYIIAIRPEGAEALTGRTDCAHNNHGLRAAALSGRLAVAFIPRACPGLGAAALSGRLADCLYTQGDALG